jgi:hypothetical protein
MQSARTVESGFSPLDEELQLLPGKLTPVIEEGLVRLGTWLPFARASQEMAYFLHVTVSERKARQDTEQAGSAYVEVQAAEVENILQQLPESPTGVDKQLLSVDGAFVALVTGEWTEVKTLTLGEIQPPNAEGVVHTEKMSYFSRMSPSSEFTQQALAETHRRGVEKSRIVCALTDGAEWIPGFVDWHRSDAVRILDFMHAAEYVASAGRAVFGEDTPEFHAWFATQRRELKDGDPDKVLTTLDMLSPPQRGPTEKACQTISTSLNYLRARRAMIDYAKFQQAGYPIGSGAGEACHKFVIQTRLKGTGMRWAPEHVNPMSALRNLVCNNRWDEGWPLIAATLRMNHHSAKPTVSQSPKNPVPDPQPSKVSLLPPGFKLQSAIPWGSQRFGKALYLPSAEVLPAKK